ncbi:MAG: class I SAM-dependent methyltransferase [Sulfuricaulis sp.]
MQAQFKGTQATREFYDRTGWRRQDGVLIDTALFNATNIGPISQSMNQRRQQLIGELIGGPGLRLVECGCGGTPAVFLLNRCASFTAVDFSSTGLTEAAAALESTGAVFKTVEADMTRLPFGDGDFDAAYSAHAIYHIDNSDGQAAALSEIMRIVRPGGRAVFVLVNPFPLLFPGRLLRRVLAMTPVISTLLNSIRTKPPLPYLPMPLGWLKSQLSKWGDVQIRCYAMPSTWFERKVSEDTKFTQWIWRALRWTEKNHPKIAARLGCYVTILVQRPEAPAS